MRFRRLLLTALVAPAIAPAAPAAQDLPFVHFQDFVDSLTAVATIPDASERVLRINALWTALGAAGRIPFAEGDSAAFLWRGTASTVQVAGDHTGWNPSGNNLARVGLSDVWMRVASLPEAARVDYKYVLNGSNWILDPANPHQQWGGAGPNSELRMPAWVFPAETVRDPATPAGTLSADQQLASDTLGYAVRYRVFTPADYEVLSDLPVIYVTDGHEYSDDRLGAVRIVVDNLVDDGRSEPVIVVFVDPRSVVNGQNQREDQYVQNPAFAYFVAHELAPAVDAAYRTRPHPDARAILGTSIGGVFSLYLGLQHPEAFGRLAAQSAALWVTEHPSWWTGPSLFELWASAPPTSSEVFLSTGTIGDVAATSRRMRDILLARGVPLTYREVPEGHSWGNWRALIDEMLIALTPGPVSAAEPPPSAARPALRAVPNPSGGWVELRFEVPIEDPGRVDCFDLQGRTVISDTVAAGATVHRLRFEYDGRYVCRATSGGASSATTVLVRRRG